MSLLPIVKHQCVELSGLDVEFAEKVAAKVIAMHPELRIESLFAHLVPKSITDAPTLHVDDLTGIQIASESSVFLQERARLRAMDGDLLATTLPPIDGYESYCGNVLGLGSVEWLTPDCQGKPLHLAEACYTDRGIRREVVRHVRQLGLRYIHPHIGSTAPWELALLMQQTSHLPIEVVAPPPALTRFVNDKGAFTKLVHAMFGDAATPPTEVVWNVANAANSLPSLPTTSRFAAIKLPSAAGGSGNLLIALDEIRGRNLAEIDALLHERLPCLRYETGNELLVTLWADELIASPSAQLWIPPVAEGGPILEGLFMQLIEQGRGRFWGFMPASLPRNLKEQMTGQCLLLAKVFQILGYVGRCSIDMLLVGRSIEDSKMKFIECNGRWGGTSLPMTLMNRLFADWRLQPFSSHTIKIEDADQVPFTDLAKRMGHRLFHRSTYVGDCILFNPQRTKVCGEVSLIALRNSWNSSDDFVGSLTNDITTGLAAEMKTKDSAVP